MSNNNNHEFKFRVTILFQFDINRTPYEVHNPIKIQRAYGAGQRDVRQKVPTIVVYRPNHKPLPIAFPSEDLRDEVWYQLVALRQNEEFLVTNKYFSGVDSLDHQRNLFREMQNSSNSPYTLQGCLYVNLTVCLALNYTFNELAARIVVEGESMEGPDLIKFFNGVVPKSYEGKLESVAETFATLFTVPKYAIKKGLTPRYFWYFLLITTKN